MAGGIVNSVVKTMQIVELLNAGGEMGVTEIARESGFEKSLVFRMLNTLKSMHYVRQNPETLKYSNSYKFFEIGQNVIRQSGLPALALRFMGELSKAAASGSVNLAVRDELMAVYVEQIESTGSITVCMKTGQSLPIYCSSVGKALIMWLDEERLAELTRAIDFVKHTPNTITSPEKLLADLKESRKRGFAIDDEEHLPGITCVAAPIFDSRGEPVAAMGIANPTVLVKTRKAVNALGRTVAASAAEFTAFLGGRSPKNGSEN
ncbi:IclR family transcriptional regulator [Deltaproteobacteria bacterium OttesenSCG-928-K17]|nr:IclR family transcriptional regulator [Deltaproteobacteria bacterium OttesenSCG-928-K17]